MSVRQDEQSLERHAIGLPAVTAQSAALIAPAAGSVAGLAFIVSYSGAATPLAFLIGLLVCVCIALVIGEYARRLPSAGSFYTYLTRTFGPKTGFVTGVALFGAYLLLFPFQLDFFGNFVSSLLAASGVHIAWWVFSAALIIVSTTLGVLGIKPSLRTGLIGLGFEMLILTIFSLVIIVKGGAGGNSIQAFNPGASLKGSGGLLTAVVYTIFAFVGFESATTLGDEAREPRRTIPRAVMLTTLVVGIFYVIVSYAVTIGYGVSTKNVSALSTAATPFNTLADKFGDGALSLFVNLAVISSFTALNIVTVVAVSRIFWKMGRDRLLPSGGGGGGVPPAPRPPVTAHRMPVQRDAGAGRLDPVRRDLRCADLRVLAVLLRHAVLHRRVPADQRGTDPLHVAGLPVGIQLGQACAAAAHLDRGDDLGTVGQHPSLPAGPAALVHLRHGRRPAGQHADRTVAGQDPA
jgi:amino acid transporter